LVRLLLWDKVAAIDAVAAHVAGRGYTMRRRSLVLLNAPAAVAFEPTVRSRAGRIGGAGGRKQRDAGE
jgi:hypothetical protein